MSTSDTAAETAESQPLPAAGTADIVEPAPRQRRGREAWIVVGGRIVVVAALIGLWQLCSGRVAPDYVISNPVDVSKAFWEYVSSSAGWVDIRTTLSEVGLGYLFGQVGGFVLGIVLGTSRLVGRIMEPLIAAAYGIPHVALAPLFIIFLGIGIWSKVTIGATIVFFVMYYNVYTGLQSINQELMSLVRLYGAGPISLIRHVVIPDMMPAILSALSAGIPFALIGAIVGEFVSATSGIGNYIVAATNAFDAAQTFAGIIVLAIIVLTANLLFRLIRARLLRWQEG
jgi:NitT/TauT family transport system permease protein